MPLHFDDNRYPGVNAHLNSALLQPDGGWESFHANWVIQLQAALEKALPRTYYAVAEKSLQISEMASETLQRTRPDVSVYQLRRTTDAPPAIAGETAPTAVLSLRDALEEMVDALSSVGIYEVVAGRVPGRLVTRLEVLSAGNKPPATYAPQYLGRRYETLRAGVNLVEIDLIHTRRPVTHLVPSYPDQHPQATPYLVLVSHPQPRPSDGQLRVYHVSIRDPLPQLAVPLSGEETAMLDLQAVYNRTFNSTRLFALLVDYASDPLAADTYNTADREWIRAFSNRLA